METEEQGRWEHSSDIGTVRSNSGPVEYSQVSRVWSSPVGGGVQLDLLNWLRPQPRANLASIRWWIFQGLPILHCSSASVYCCQHKLKNEKQGRPGNTAARCLLSWERSCQVFVVMGMKLQDVCCHGNEAASCLLSWYCYTINTLIWTLPILGWDVSAHIVCILDCFWIMLMLYVDL